MGPKTAASSCRLSDYQSIFYSLDFNCPSLPSPPLVPPQGYALVPLPGSPESDIDFGVKIKFECPKTPDGEDTFISFNQSITTLELECLQQGYFETWPTGAFCYPHGSMNLISL